MQAREEYIADAIQRLAVSSSQEDDKYKDKTGDGDDAQPRRIGRCLVLLRKLIRDFSVHIKRVQKYEEELEKVNLTLSHFLSLQEKLAKKEAQKKTAQPDTYKFEMRSPGKGNKQGEFSKWNTVGDVKRKARGVFNFRETDYLR